MGILTCCEYGMNLDSDETSMFDSIFIYQTICSPSSTLLISISISQDSLELFEKKTYVVHELSPGLIQNAFYVPAALNFFSFVQKSSSPSMLGSSRSGRYRRPSPSHRPWPISISDGGRRCHVNRHVSLFGQSSWLLLRILHRFLVGASHN